MFADPIAQVGLYAFVTAGGMVALWLVIRLSAAIVTTRSGTGFFLGLFIGGWAYLVKAMFVGHGSLLEIASFFLIPAVLGLFINVLGEKITRMHNK